jgi:hypothetical protein
VTTSRGDSEALLTSRSSADTHTGRRRVRTIERASSLLFRVATGAAPITPFGPVRGQMQQHIVTQTLDLLPRWGRARRSEAFARSSSGRLRRSSDFSVTCFSTNQPLPYGGPRPGHRPSAWGFKHLTKWHSLQPMHDVRGHRFTHYLSRAATSSVHRRTLMNLTLRKIKAGAARRGPAARSGMRSHLRHAGLLRRPGRLSSPSPRWAVPPASWPPPTPGGFTDGARLQPAGHSQQP